MSNETGVQTSGYDFLLAQKSTLPTRSWLCLPLFSLWSWVWGVRSSPSTGWIFSRSSVGHLRPLCQDQQRTAASLGILRVATLVPMSVSANLFGVSSDALVIGRDWPVTRVRKTAQARTPPLQGPRSCPPPLAPPLWLPLLPIHQVIGILGPASFLGLLHVLAGRAASRLYQHDWSPHERQITRYPPPAVGQDTRK